MQTGPAGSKLIYQLGTDDPVMCSREAPVAFGFLNRAAQSRSIEKRGTCVARQKRILAALISKPAKDGLPRSNVVVHAKVTLIAGDRGRKVRHIVIGDCV